MSLPTSTRQIILRERPHGQLKSEQMLLRSVPLPELQAGQVLVRVNWLSLDPLIRIRIGAEPLGGALVPLPIGDPIGGPAVGQVLHAGTSDIPVGSMVEGRFPWQDYAIMPAEACRQIDTQGLPPQAALGVLGLPGLTAFTGLHIARQARPEAKRLIISGAAGAVGSIAGQLAKIGGWHVTGVANGPDRCAYLRESVGLNVVLDRSEPAFLSRLADSGPYDVFFDNVGGSMLTDVTGRMAPGGLILICGLMAQYNRQDRTEDPLALEPFLETMMGRQLELRTFAAAAHGNQQDFLDSVVPLIRAGHLSLPETIADGIESAPAAFENVFLNGGIGKQLVRLQV